MARREATSLFVAIALIVTPALASLPGTASIEQGPLAAEDEIDLETGEHIELDPRGTGWSRLVLTSHEKVKFNVSIQHETIEDLGLHTDEGEGIYDGGHYTFAYALPLGEERAGFQDGPPWSFEWWGFNDTAKWPIGETKTNLSVGPDQPMVVVLATNVPGYTLHLNANSTSQEPDAERTWHLGDHPELEINWPSPDHSSTVSETNAGLQETWRWSQERNLSSDALVKLQWWQRFDKPSLVAGTQELDWAVYRGSQGDPGEGCDPSSPSPPSLPSVPPGPGPITLPGTGVLTSCLPGVLLAAKSPYQAPCDPNQPLTETRCCYVVDRSVEVPPGREVGPVRACPYLGTATDWSVMTNTTYRPAMDDPILWDVEYERSWAGVDNTGFGAGFATIPLER